MSTNDHGTRPDTETAKRLRAARALTALSQTDFADLIGVSRSIVSQYERASNTCHYKRPFLLAWAYYANVRLEWIVTGEGPVTADVERPISVTVPHHVSSLLGTTLAGRALAMA